MTTRTPLVVIAGQTQQMPAGDAVPLAHGGTGATTAGGALTALEAVPTARTLTVSAPLTGGGDLSANRTLALTIDSTLGVTAGALGVVAVPATMITGTLADARLSGNVALRNAANTFSAEQTISTTGYLAQLTLSAMTAGAPVHFGFISTSHAYYFATSPGLYDAFGIYDATVGAWRFYLDTAGRPIFPAIERNPSAGVISSYATGTLYAVSDGAGGYLVKIK